VGISLLYFLYFWLRSPDRDGETLLGSGDIQSLADLGNAFGVIKEMQAFPIGRDTFLRLLAAALVPFAPLLLILMPIEVLLDRVIGAVFRHMGRVGWAVIGPSTYRCDPRITVAYV